MRHINDELTQNLAERLCWEVARRDDGRTAPMTGSRALIAAKGSADFPPSNEGKRAVMARVALSPRTF